MHQLRFLSSAAIPALVCAIFVYPNVLRAEEIDGGAPLESSSPEPSAPALIAAPAAALPRPISGPPGIPRARFSKNEAPSQLELDDEAGLKHPTCDLRYVGIFPGVSALCTGRVEEGSALLNIGVLELGAGLAAGSVNGFSTPGAEVPLLGFGDLLTATSVDAGIRLARARHLPYTPEDTLSDDFSAPFRLEVLKQPDVYLGIIGMVGLGVLYEQFIDGPYSTQSFGQKPRLFGQNVNSAVAYPAAALIGVGLFSQVAVAEELAFRGTIQSNLTRSYGEIPGWLGGSLVFGLFHASNALFLPPDQRTDYLLRGVPFITLVGGYLGYSYMHHNYSLAPSIALHFWYDFLIEATGFLLDPKNSPLAFSYAF